MASDTFFVFTRLLHLATYIYKHVSIFWILAAGLLTPLSLFRYSGLTVVDQRPRICNFCKRSWLGLAGVPPVAQRDEQDGRRDPGSHHGVEFSRR